MACISLLPGIHRRRKAMGAIQEKMFAFVLALAITGATLNTILV